jgi:hypothetical protein
MRGLARASAIVFGLVVFVWVVVFAVLGGGGQPARADGAFPDSNFGLVSSRDDGASWTWSCEGPLTNGSTLYGVGAAPRDRLFTIADDDLLFSDDRACHWSIARGAGTAGAVVDAFPFPLDAARVLAVVSPTGVGAATAYTVVASSDGGATFDDVRFTAAAGDVVTGVEVARGDADTWVVTLASGPGFQPGLALSSDAGARWRHVDLSATLQASGVRLVAIDHLDPRRVFLRVSRLEGEALAVFDAADDSVRVPVTFDGGLMTAFAQTEEGTLVAAGRLHGDAALVRSLDGGATWLAVPGAPHVRALAARAGQLFAAADDTLDGFALGVSSDGGLTFRALLRFAAVRAIDPCVRVSCLDLCYAKAASGLWPAAMCAVAPAPEQTKETAGCSCGVAPGGDRSTAQLPSTLALSAVLWVALACSLRARRRRPGDRAAPPAPRGPP